MQHSRLLLLLLLLLLGLPGSHLLAQTGSRTFPETGYTVSGLFLDYWLGQGGLAQQGYPLSNEFREVSELDGTAYTVQYFERAVFERHPENAGTPYEVLLTQLGAYRYQAKYPTGAPGQQASHDNPQFFAQTSKTLGGRFRKYWETHGGLAQQGYPLSEEFTEPSDLDPDKTYTVQYFERAVFEYHPENAPPYDVLLAQLGRFRLDQRRQPPPHHAPAGQEFGVQQSHVLWLNQDLDHIRTWLDHAQAGGMQWLRLDVAWMDAEPQRGQWGEAYLSRLDWVVWELRKRGIKPIAILQTAPAWAKTVGPGCWADGQSGHEWAIPPNDPADYAAAARYLARRYAGLIQTWEVWNEPNLCDFWNAPGGAPDAARYTALLRAAYPAFKGVDPGITVLGGSLAGNDFAYLEAMYAAGARDAFDALSIHPYTEANGDPTERGSGRGRWCFACLPAIQQTLIAHSDAAKPIWITEMGWSTTSPPSGGPPVPDGQRADYFRKAVQLVRTWPYVKVFIAYYLERHQETAPDGYELWVDGQPTDSWRAYVTAAGGHP